MLAEEIGPKLAQSEQVYWLSTLEVEHDNLRQAITYCIEDPRGGEVALRLTAALWRLWSAHGHLSEGRGWFAAALAHPGSRSACKPRADALNGAGNLASSQGDYDESRSLYEESLALRKMLGDRAGVASSLSNLAVLLGLQGEPTAVRTALLENVLLINIELVDRAATARTLSNLGSIAYEQGDNAKARSLYERGMVIDREIGDKRALATCLLNLGRLAHDEGDRYSSARGMLDESLTMFRELGDMRLAAQTVSALGNVAQCLGDLSKAEGMFRESLETAIALGDRLEVAYNLNTLGNLALIRQELMERRTSCRSRALHSRVSWEPRNKRRTLYGYWGKSLRIRANILKRDLRTMRA